MWNVSTGQCINTLRGHNDEILDVAFNATGSKLVTACALTLTLTPTPTPTPTLTLTP